MAHFTLRKELRERAARVEDDVIVLGQRVGLSILRENCTCLCYRESAIRGRYRIKLMESIYGEPNTRTGT